MERVCRCEGAIAAMERGTIRLWLRPSEGGNRRLVYHSGIIAHARTAYVATYALSLMVWYLMSSPRTFMSHYI
jgi:hypothetical protein